MSAAEDILNALADLVADRVAERLRSAAVRTVYSQDNPPAGMSKRTYLDHCHKRTWPTQKVGRLRMTNAADYDAWRNAHPVRPARSIRVVDDVDDAGAFLDKIGAK